MGTGQKKKTILLESKSSVTDSLHISLYFVYIIDENFPCSLSSFNCIKRIDNICFSSTTFWSSPPICSSYDLLASATCLSEFMLAWHLCWHWRISSGFEDHITIKIHNFSNHQQSKSYTLQVMKIFNYRHQNLQIQAFIAKQARSNNDKSKPNISNTNTRLKSQHLCKHHLINPISKWVFGERGETWFFCEIAEKEQISN